ncbi:hypothetical protein H2248_011165 [Termitomyces sp. 'cryptogamus']|nr:hypothetical protein H2248_011165 [Termitomyces sp. 'cryptogamus']
MQSPQQEQIPTSRPNQVQQQQNTLFPANEPAPPPYSAEGFNTTLPPASSYPQPEIPQFAHTKDER